jgi:thiamine kinase-like enzyme
MKTQIDYFESKTSIKVHTIHSIYGGLNSNNYLINDTYVLRMKLPIIDEFYQPSIESQIEILLQTENVSTQLVYFDQQFGHKVTRYIPFVTHFDKHHLHRQWPLIVAHLNKLHAISIPTKLEFNSFKRMKTYQKRGDTAPLISNENEFFTRIELIEKKYPNVLSHNDLVQGNMLFKGEQSWLIDFEYASYNSLLFDYFSFISENQITHELDLEWTQSIYFQQNQKLDSNDFRLYHAFVDLLWYYWAKAMHRQTQSPIYESIASDKKHSFFNYFQPSK